MTNQLSDVWKKINRRGEDDCWEWVGACDSGGYGRMGLDGKYHPVHRLAYKSIYGNISDKINVLHTCDNRKCCNPNHLFLGTDKDNAIDKVRKGRQQRLCGELNGRCKLTNEQVKEIRILYSTNNYSYTQLSNKYNVTKANISNIINYKLWKHI